MQRYFLNKGASQNLIYCDVTPRPFAFSIGKHNFLADATASSWNVFREPILP